MSKANFFLDSGEDGAVYEAPASVSAVAHVKTMTDYQKLHSQSLTDPDAFWEPLVNEFYFKERPKGKKMMEYNFNVNNGPIFVKFLEGAKTNVCYNVLDRHVKNGLGDKTAFYWEGNYPGDECTYTYKELMTEVCKFANVLKSKGVKKGDRVAIYLPMIMSLPVVMLACARIGAVHSIVFGGFSSASLAARIIDAKAKVVITADGVWRGPKVIRLKDITDGAIKICKESGHVVTQNIVVKHMTSPPHGPPPPADEIVPGKRPSKDLKYDWNPSIDFWYHDLISGASDECEPEWLDAEDPLFMLYTSGSTGTPKGVVHTQIGYLLYASTTFRYVFDHHPDSDVYFCTADIGWITGHSYVTYGPLANAATSVIFEGVPFFPDPSRFWKIVDKYKVTKFYTAPTAIRALMKHGENFVKKYDRKSLQVLGTVGEPINPEAWRWFHNVVGDKRCAIVDTYWQTETGGHVLTPLPGCTTTKPGSATFPFFGIEPAILTEEGKEIEGPGEGYLVFKRPWPGTMRTVYGNHERYQKTYFAKFPGYYCSGDGCRRDEDGYYWITGRIDDMMNCSGHLMSTAEIESALVAHPAVAEAAVVAAKHDIKGEVPYAFVTLRSGYKFSPELTKELNLQIREKIGPFAIPEAIQEAPGLPKTRSGKIMRRILRVVAAGDESSSDGTAFGDTSTLAEPEIINQLIESRVPIKA